MDESQYLDCCKVKEDLGAKTERTGEKVRELKDILTECLSLNLSLPETETLFTGAHTDKQRMVLDGDTRVVKGGTGLSLVYFLELTSTNSKMAINCCFM